MKNSENFDNVIDLQEVKSVLQKKLRAVLNSHYMESKELERNPDEFAQTLEERLISMAAHSVIRAGASMIKGKTNGKN